MKNLASIIFLERPVEDLDWVIYILVLTMVIVAIGRVLFNNNFESLRRFDRFLEVNDNQALFGLLFQIVFAILFSSIIVTFFSGKYDYLLHTPYLKVGVLSILILVFFGVRTLLNRVASFAFGITYDRIYNTKTFNYFRVYLVVALWIAILLFYFTPINRFILLGILLIFMIIIRVVSYMRVMKNQQDKKSKIWYYNILYLCALEILPMLVLFKLLSVW